MSRCQHRSEVCLTPVSRLLPRAAGANPGFRSFPMKLTEAQPWQSASPALFPFREKNQKNQKNKGKWDKLQQFLQFVRSFRPLNSTIEGAATTGQDPPCPAGRGAHIARGEMQWWQQGSGLRPRHWPFKEQSYPLLQDNTEKESPHFCWSPTLCQVLSTFAPFGSNLVPPSVWCWKNKGPSRRAQLWGCGEAGWLICPLRCCRKDLGQLPRMHNVQPEQKIRVWEKKKETQRWGSTKELGMKLKYRP